MEYSTGEIGEESERKLVKVKNNYSRINVKKEGSSSRYKHISQISGLENKTNNGGKKTTYLSKNKTLSCAKYLLRSLRYHLMA